MISKVSSAGAIWMVTAVLWMAGVTTLPASAGLYLGRTASQTEGLVEETFAFEIVVDGAFLGGLSLESASFESPMQGVTPLNPVPAAGCREENCFRYKSDSYSTASARDADWPDGTYEITITVDESTETAELPVNWGLTPNPDADYQIQYPTENPATLPENAVYFTFTTECSNCADFEALIAGDISGTWEVLRTAPVSADDTWFPPASIDWQQEVNYNFSVYAYNQISGDVNFSGVMTEVPYQIYSDRSNQVLFTVPEPSLGLLQGAALGVVVWLAGHGSRRRRGNPGLRPVSLLRIPNLVPKTASD